MSEHPSVPSERDELLRHLREFHSMPADNWRLYRLRTLTVEQLQDVHVRQHHAEFKKTGRFK